MLLKSFGISNFKAFGHSLQQMPIKPITLIFGPNSAGKSSLLQSFLWSLHAAESGEFSKPSPAIASGSIDLGGFQSLIHRSDSERRIECEICLQAEGGEPVRIVHQLGLPSRTDLIKTEDAWIAESPMTKQYLEQTRIAGDSRHWIKLLFLYLEPSQKEVDTVLADDEALQAQIDKVIARGEEDGRDWFEGTSPTLEFFRDAAAKGRAAWDEVQKLRPLLDEITRHQERVRVRIESERQALGLLSVEILHGNEIALKATRLSGKRTLACQILDSQVIAKLPSPKEAWVEAGGRRTGNRSWKTMFRGYEVELPNTEDFQNVPQDAIEKVFAWLRGSLEQSRRSKGQLVYLGPLRHLPKRRELLGVRGETANDHSLAPWLRLRDEPSIREKVNQLLKELNSQPCEFVAQLAARPQDVVQTAEGFGAIMTTEFDPTNPRWFEAETVTWGSNDKHPDFEQMRAEGEAAAFEKLDARLLEKYGWEVLIDLGIRDKRHGVVVPIRDVGTGISQIAPVLVHAVAEEGKIIAIEQPEIHIHPALQAELGDVFIKSALGENKNTFLLETHSEHLILRILRRIRETTLGKLPAEALPISKDDVSVLFVVPSSEGSVVRELRIDDRGKFLDSWPGGFFEESFNEMF